MRLVDALVWGTPAQYDGVRRNRFYFSTPVTQDSAGPGQIPVDGGVGKTVIRLHHSRTQAPAGGCSSAGCVVSGNYYDLTDALIDIYQTEQRALNGQADATVTVLAGRTFQTAMNLYEGCGAALTGPNWNDKIAGTFWLIRPDERPL
jgi:hypothetical protein